MNHESSTITRLQYMICILTVKSTIYAARTKKPWSSQLVENEPKTNGEKKTFSRQDICIFSKMCLTKEILTDLMYQLYKGKDVNTKNYDIFAEKLDKWLKQRLLLVS